MAYGRPSSTNDPRDYIVIGNVITGTGLYTRPITGTQQVITKAFSTVGYSDAVLFFDRFLGIMAGDIVTVHGCTVSPSACYLMWQNTGAVVDTTWTRVTHMLPALTRNSPSVQIRFGLGPVVATGASSFGWNIRNILVIGT